MAIVKPCEQRTFCCSDVFNAMQKKESNVGRDLAGNKIPPSASGIGMVGDRGLRNPAYGPFQIRLPYWKDATRGKPITYNGQVLTFPESVLTSRGASELIACKYMERYLKKFRPKDKFSRSIGDGPFERITNCKGTMADVEKVARIHNGGPNGHKKDSTKEYWNGGTDTHPDFKMWLCEVTKHK